MSKLIILCPDCGEEKEHHARGFCSICYRRWYRANGRKVICANCGEEKVHRARGLCGRCYTNQCYQENIEKRRTSGRRYYWRNQEARRAYRRRYYWEHREECLAYSHRYQQEHREERLAYKRKYRQEHCEEMQVYQRRYDEEHREERREYDRRRRKENPEKVRAIHLKYRKFNKSYPEKNRLNASRRRARERSVPDTLTSERAEELLAIGQATYPGEKLHLDHVIPISKGGGTTPGNVHFIPVPLNRRKWSKLPREIYEQLPLEDYYA